MQGETVFHTDLALEARNNIAKDEAEKIKGIKVEREEYPQQQVNVIRMDVLNRYGSETIGKPVGAYITMEIPALCEGTDQETEQISELLAAQLKSLVIETYEWNESMPKILVVGLGNREATPDSLGPRVVDNIMVTRHLMTHMEEYGADGLFAVTSAIVPGVMAQTGMETSEIISAIVRKTKPDMVIAVDALAARNVDRLCKTIQISDAGIHPGSGVGNYREAITKRSLGVPVLAIGIPTVVDAAHLVGDLCNSTVTKPEAALEALYVTPKDIDAMMQKISRIISDALNLCMGKLKNV